jgi:hypothetical protein
MWAGGMGRLSFIQAQNKADMGQDQSFHLETRDASAGSVGTVNVQTSKGAYCLKLALLGDF